MFNIEKVIMYSTFAFMVVMFIVAGMYLKERNSFFYFLSSALAIIYFAIFINLYDKVE